MFLLTHKKIYIFKFIAILRCNYPTNEKTSLIPKQILLLQRKLTSYLLLANNIIIIISNTVKIICCVEFSYYTTKHHHMLGKAFDTIDLFPVSLSSFLHPQFYTIHDWVLFNSIVSQLYTKHFEFVDDKNA